ncbi:MAG: DegV family protein [Bacilli bacterium]|nr:DegV family protein [Bacilli bacterium]
MNAKFIGDSGLDLRSNENFYTRVPFNIKIENIEYVDQDLDTDALLNTMHQSSQGIKTSCPAPTLFYNQFDKDKDNYVVCISSKLSGSYNSALVARDMFNEENKSTNIAVFDTKSAACGENLVMLKIKELVEKNLSFNEIVKKVNHFISTMKTYFILESYDNLVKNGRMKSIVAKGAALLKIVPIMGDNGNGEIALKHLARGNKNAFKKLVDSIADSKEKLNDRILTITNIKCREKAEQLKKLISEKYQFKDIKIYDAYGLSCAYGDTGGLILTF